MSKKKPNSPPVTNDDEESVEVDMGAINKLLNKEIKDDDIQLTDADMEDPELLSMLSQIESGGSLPRPQQQAKKPAPQPVVKQQPKVDEDDDGEYDDELNELIMGDDEDVDLNDLDDNPTPTKKSKTSQPQQSTSKPQPTPTQSTPSNQQQIQNILKELEERKDIYTKNALLYGNAGQQKEATKFIQSTRIIASAIEKIKKGDLSSSLKDIPPKISLVTLDQLKQQTSTTTTTTTTTTTKLNSSNSSTTTTPVRTSTTSTPKSVSPQTKIEILSRERIEQEERQQVWELIEIDYINKYHFLSSEALRLRDTDKIQAITLLKQSKTIRTILDQIATNKTNGTEPPPFRFEEKTTNKEVTFLHLKENELEIIISKPEMEKVFGNSDCYIQGEFPYPESLQKFQTTTFNTSKDTFSFTSKLSYERKKSYERVLEKKKLSLVFYSQRMIFMKSVIGKADIKLVSLLNKCEITERVPILKEGSKRETGAFINVTLRARTPLLKREVLTSVEKVLVLDQPIEITHTTTTTTTTTPVQPVSKPQPQQPVSKPQPTQPVSKPQPQQPVSKPQPTQPTTTPTPVAKPQPTQPQQPVPKPQPTQPTQPVSKPQASTEEDDDDDDEYDSIDKLVSNNVLESMLEGLKLQIQKQGAKPELLEQKQAIEVKLQVLEVQVQSGLLTIEAYVKQVQDAIEADKKLAVRLNAKGEKDKALKVMQRVKTMKSELEDS